MRQVKFCLSLGLVVAVLALGTSTGSSDIATNVCHMDWYYCPRDPGCSTYTMSVKEVFVYANGHVNPISAENLTVGDKISVEVRGSTTMKSVPVAGSFRIYNLQGGNMFAGVLADTLTLSGNNFVFKTSFTLDSGAFATGRWVEWGLDISGRKWVQRSYVH